MTKEVKLFCDFDNIETYYDSPFDPPEGEYRVLSVYFPLKTTDEEIKEIMKTITKKERGQE